MDVYDVRRINLKHLAADPQHGGLVGIGQACGIHRSYLSALVNSVKSNRGVPRQVGSEVARKVETGLKLPSGWMDSLHHAGSRLAGTTDLVPVIGWADVAAWINPKQSASATQRKRLLRAAHLPVRTTAPVTDQTFAVQVTGHVMEPEFTRGSTLIVEPSLQPRHRDFVILVSDPREDATCGQILIDAQHTVVRPFNPKQAATHIKGRYADRSAVVAGVVRQQLKTYR